MKVIDAVERRKLKLIEKLCLLTERRELQWDRTVGKMYHAAWCNRHLVFGDDGGLVLRVLDSQTATLMIEAIGSQGAMLRTMKALGKLIAKQAQVESNYDPEWFLHVPATRRSIETRELTRLLSA